MSALAVVLVLIASFMHAGWNCLSKHVSPSMASFTVAATLGATCISPALFFLRDGLVLINGQILVILLFSCFFQAFYMAALGESYRHGDMSVIYPVTRALPVLWVPLVVSLSGQGGALGWEEWLAFFIVVLGCFVLPLGDIVERQWRSFINPATGFALLAALGTTGYSVVDSLGVQAFLAVWHTEYAAFKTAILYMILQAIGSALFLMLFSFLFTPARLEVKRLLSEEFSPLLKTGIALFLTYGFILAAMAFTDNVSRIVALRQLSIPIGVCMGVFWLREAASMPKWIGTGLIISGLIWLTA